MSAKTLKQILKEARKVEIWTGGTRQTISKEDGGTYCGGREKLQGGNLAEYRTGFKTIEAAYRWVIRDEENK